jgi:hypothetical protein
MVFLRRDVDKLYARRNIRGLLRMLRYSEDESIQQKAKDYLIAMGGEAGEAILQIYEQVYSDRPVEEEGLEDALAEIGKRDDITLDRIVEWIIGRPEGDWLRENLEDVLVKAGEKAIFRLIQEADHRRGGIPLVEGTLRKMGKPALGPLSEVAAEGVKSPGEVKRILEEMQGGPVHFEVKDNASRTPALLNLVESAALHTALSSCSSDDLYLLRLKIENARERGADGVEVSRYCPEFKNRVKIGPLEKTLHLVLEERKAKEEKERAEGLGSIPPSGKKKGLRE